jgi:hypothetical protein
MKLPAGFEALKVLVSAVEVIVTRQISFQKENTKH